MSESQTLEGDLRSTDLPQVLKSLAAWQSTGILTVQGEDDIVAVSCLGGHIVTADSLNQTQEESLGELLASSNLVAKSEFDAVVMEQQQSGGSLAELLVSRELITREKLLECFRVQTYRLMLQILTWREGEFKFYGGDEVSYEKGVTPISVDEMLMRALAELGPESGVGGEVPKLDVIYRQVPPSGPIQVLGRDGNGGPGTWITELQHTFLERMDNETTAFDIARSLGTGRFRTLYSIHQLVQNDLIEKSRSAPSPARERPAENRGVAPTVPETPVPGAPRPPAGSPRQRPSAGPPSAGPPSAGPPSAGPPSAGPPNAAPAKVAPGPSASVSRASVTSDKVREAIEEDEHGLMSLPATPLPWVGPALALLLFIAIVFSVLEKPTFYVLPFSWQASQRAALERQMRLTLFQKIENAIGTFYMMDFQYPRDLETLRGHGLLSPLDTKDPAGERLRFLVDESGCRLIIGEGESAETRNSSIQGDFVRDQDYFPPEDVRNPLVLLD